MSEPGAERILRLPCPPEVALASAFYCCRSPSLPAWRKPGAAPDWLRQRIALTAAELLLQRWLTAMDAPLHLRSAAPFTEPGGQRLLLGGRLCEILLHAPPHGSKAAAIPEVPISLPWEAAYSPYHQDEGLLLFAAALPAPPGNQPPYYAFLPPPGWMRPSPWRSLGRMIIELRGEQPFFCELSGLGQDGGATSETIHARPRQPLHPAGEYFALTCMHGESPPPAYLRLYSPGLRRAVVAWPERWAALHATASEFHFLGYLTRRELRQRAEVINPTELRLSPHDLHPLPSLLHLLRAWEG